MRKEHEEVGHFDKAADDARGRLREKIRKRQWPQASLRISMLYFSNFGKDQSHFDVF